MKDKIVWFLLGIFMCLCFVLLLGAQNYGYCSITTSSDGKYVYVTGSFSDQYYRSEDFGNTFRKFDIAK
jgi:hypothetical protein